MPVDNVEKNDIDLSPMTGNIEPTGIVHGKKGQIYTEVISELEAYVWINVDGGTTWV